MPNGPTNDTQTGSQRRNTPTSAFAFLFLLTCTAIDGSPVATNDNDPTYAGFTPRMDMPSHFHFVYACMNGSTSPWGDGNGAEDSQAEDAATPRASATPTTKRRRRRSPASSASTNTSTDALSGSLGAPSSTTTEATAVTPSVTPPPPCHIPTSSIVFRPLFATRDPATAPADTLNGLPALFVGQLKKDAAAETLADLLAALAPNVNVVHIEPMINPETGQGRGCAWVYLRSASDAAALLALNHRVYMDIDESGVLGYRMCDPQDVQELKRYSDGRTPSDLSRRSRYHLCRHPLVVEWASGGRRGPSAFNGALPHPRPSPPVYGSAPPACAAWIPASRAPTATTPQSSPAALGPFPRRDPQCGVVYVSPTKFRYDPYGAVVVPPSYSMTVNRV